MKKSSPFFYRKIFVLPSIIIIAFALLQLSASSFKNPAVAAEIQLPEEIKQILERACYDCHSNQSQFEWFDKIVPASYLVAHDVKEGRSRFNFSEWDNNPPAIQEVLLWEMVNAIEQEKMPLKRYTWLHPDRKVSKAELTALKRYVNTLPGRRKIDTAKIKHSVNQPTQTNKVITNHPVALNGISYTPAYKNWKVISVTDKYDGGSMRIVYGNDIMIKAIKEKKLPFPDGAMMAKLVWGKQRMDKNGDTFPGNFQNVQLMIKDSKKYSSTEGWGFARFDGLELKPYGKTAAFEKTCINCHRLLVPQNDFVFNIPTKPIN